MTTVDELLAAARRDVDAGAIPACQLAVARDGELAVFETFGDATNDTRFCIFSATKPIVASAVWLLIGDGLLDVTRPVAEYVPEFAQNGMHAVSVEQVLLHTSGFPHAVMPERDGADPHARRERFAQWRLEWEPGSRFEYHGGSAHWVLADLVERLGGCDFRDFIEARVSRPLGLPRLLGIPEDAQDGIAPLVAVEPDAPRDATTADLAVDEFALRLNRPDVRAAGVPGGGGIMRAADLALFYQGVLHNPGGLWDAAVLDDAKTNVRNTFPDPLMGASANRTLGLVVAGDDGRHFLRYGSFGPSNSPRSFGHAGAFMQIGWADPETGLSFAYCHNCVHPDQLAAGARGVHLSDLAASLDL